MGGYAPRRLGRVTTGLRYFEDLGLDYYAVGFGITEPATSVRTASVALRVNPGVALRIVCPGDLPSHSCQAQTNWPRRSSLQRDTPPLRCYHSTTYQGVRRALPFKPSIPVKVPRAGNNTVARVCDHTYRPYAADAWVHPASHSPSLAAKSSYAQRKTREGPRTLRKEQACRSYPLAKNHRMPVKMPGHFIAPMHRGTAAQRPRLTLLPPPYHRISVKSHSLQRRGRSRAATYTEA